MKNTDITVYFKLAREDAWKLKRLALDMGDRGISNILRRLVSAKLAEKRTAKAALATIDMLRSTPRFERGIEAIELLDYLLTPNDMSEMRINRLLDRWHGEDDFLDWVREERKKHAKS